ncbi:hypothetical protein Hanom_Chr10g00917351 [Helianthus anomalus]
MATVVVNNDVLVQAVSVEAGVWLGSIAYQIRKFGSAYCSGVTVSFGWVSRLGSTARFGQRWSNICFGAVKRVDSGQTGQLGLVWVSRFESAGSGRI